MQLELSHRKLKSFKKKTLWSFDSEYTQVFFLFEISLFWARSKPGKNSNFEGYRHVAILLIDQDWTVPAPIILDITLLEKKHRESFVSFQEKFMNTITLSNVFPLKFEAFTHFKIQRSICTYLQISIKWEFPILHEIDIAESNVNHNPLQNGECALTLHYSFWKSMLLQYSLVAWYCTLFLYIIYSIRTLTRLIIPNVMKVVANISLGFTLECFLIPINWNKWIPDNTRYKVHWWTSTNKLT